MRNRSGQYPRTFQVANPPMNDRLFWMSRNSCFAYSQTWLMPAMFNRYHMLIMCFIAIAMKPWVFMPPALATP